MVVRQSISLEVVYSPVGRWRTTLNWAQDMQVAPRIHRWGAPRVPVRSCPLLRLVLRREQLKHGRWSCQSFQVRFQKERSRNVRITTTGRRGTGDTPRRGVTPVTDDILGLLRHRRFIKVGSGSGNVWLYIYFVSPGILLTDEFLRV